MKVYSIKLKLIGKSLRNLRERYIFSCRAFPVLLTLIFLNLIGIEMGANAIINYLYRVRTGLWYTHSHSTGTAVNVEDVRKYFQGQECSHCGKRVKVIDHFCGFCGSKL